MRAFILLFAMNVVMSGLCVPIDLYAIADEDGTDVTIGRSSFEEILSGINAIYSQVALTFELRSYAVITNREWIVIDTKSEFLDVLDSCPSTNGVPVYVFREITGPIEGLSLRNEGCSIEVGAGAAVLAHELGHMCGLDDIYGYADNKNERGVEEEISVYYDGAREEWQPMDWGRYPAGTTQGEIIGRMLMNGYSHTGVESGVDITAGDVYGIIIGEASITNAVTGEISRKYEKGMSKVGFLLHGNRNPSRVVRNDE